ncbi:MAG: hypothetical protein WBL95_10600 [Microcoleus sp.]
MGSSFPSRAGKCGDRVGRSRGELETGFLTKILVGMLRLSQKPGFLDSGDFGWGVRNRVSA